MEARIHSHPVHTNQPPALISHLQVLDQQQWEEPSSSTLSIIKNTVLFNGTGIKARVLVLADWVASAAAAARYLHAHGQTLWPAQNVLFARIMLLLSQVVEGRECVRLTRNLRSLLSGIFSSRSANFPQAVCTTREVKAETMMMLH